MADKQTFVTGFLKVMVQMDIMREDEARGAEQGFRESEKEIFTDFLMEEGLVDREDILRALSQYYQVPSFDVIGYFFETQLLHKFPKDVMLRAAFIPLEVDENMLIVVASEPDDADLLSIIGDNVSYDVQFRVGIRGDITDAIKEFYEKSLTEIDEDEDLREERRLGGQERRQELRDEEVFYGEDEIVEGFQEVGEEDEE